MNKSLLFKGYAQRFLRQGRLFHHLLYELEQNQKLSYSELIEYQNQKLRQTVKRAYQEVPYYKQLFDRLKLKPEAIQTVEDLQLLPVLNKSDIRDKEQQFASSRVRWKFKAFTSGTTGTPLRLYRDHFNINLEQATLWRKQHWGGFAFNDRRATLQGHMVTPADSTQPPFWQYIPAEKQLLMSSYHLSNKFIPYYLQKLRDFQPAAMEAYPSSIYRLARYMQIHQELPISVKAVFTSSEMLLDHQREAIEKYFGPVFAHYGQAERVAHFSMCELGNYHYAMDYSIVEFLPTERDGLYQIVGTTLNNAAMPLIRYVTGDLARLSTQSCPCGRPFPVIETIEGRQDDYMVTPSGKWLGRLDVVLKRTSNLVETQMIQEKLNLVRVLIVPTENFTQKDEAILRKKLEERFGLEMQIAIQKVDAIPLTKQGKYQAVISHVRM
ncbi:MAG: hypothetical protein QNJ34_23385 [Xenococcaceae cyanobacterium MO_188.B29]|nr:hypothetical protein [Xenococcaceae cyanobacterium MO_188.B29]